MEASLISAIMIKISMSKHEFGDPIAYMAFEYDKQADAVNVQIDPKDTSKSKTSLVKVTLMSWWISQINQLEQNHKVAIKTMKVNFNAVNQQLETEVIYDQVD